MVYFILMDKIVSALTVFKIGKEHSEITCPKCNYFSKPHGLGKRLQNKIQLVRRCRHCNNLFWYWISYCDALTPFSDT